MQLILNDTIVTTERPSGTVLVDFLREEKHLKGTKIGCREGDCGACTIIVGELHKGNIRYRNIISCITPLGNVAGRHVVTIEGINGTDLSPVQQALVDQAGTQCGFCTVGFVMSLTGYSLGEDTANTRSAISAIDGNICRCTGYKPIERAAHEIVKILDNRPQENRLAWLSDRGFIPDYFKSIHSRLTGLHNSESNNSWAKAKVKIVGGGTDLYVQCPDDFVGMDVVHANQRNDMMRIHVENNTVRLGAASVVTDLIESKELLALIPQLYSHIKLIASTPIRNSSTLAGNIVNASPIGDLTAFFIALNSRIELEGSKGKRSLLLKDLYLGYKELDMAPDEIITEVWFPLPGASFLFNFEKVSKRTYLDIASVNTAIGIEVKDDLISEIHISAGGVGPTPMELSETGTFLTGKALTLENVKSALQIVQEEISPISDVRGSQDYKRLLLNQLITAHFHNLFPDVMRKEIPV